MSILTLIGNIIAICTVILVLSLYYILVEEVVIFKLRGVTLNLVEKYVVASNFDMTMMNFTKSLIVESKD